MPGIGYAISALYYPKSCQKLTEFLGKLRRYVGDKNICKSTVNIQWFKKLEQCSVVRSDEQFRSDELVSIPENLPKP